MQMDIVLLNLQFDSDLGRDLRCEVFYCFLFYFKELLMNLLLLILSKENFIRSLSLLKVTEKALKSNFLLLFLYLNFDNNFSGKLQVNVSIISHLLSRQMSFDLSRVFAKGLFLLLLLRLFLFLHEVSHFES